MNKLAELQARLDELKAKGLGIIQQADDDSRDLTAEETTALEAVETEVDETKMAIAAEQKKADARRRMNAISSSTGLTPAGNTQVNDPNPATTFGFKDLMEFAVSVRQASGPGGDFDPRLKNAAPANFQTGGGDAGEGFSLPSEFRDTIFEVMENTDEFGPMVDEEATSARRVEMLANEETPWGTSGVQANWRSEGSQMSASKLDDQARSVALHEIYAFVLATGELLADAPRMAGRLSTRAGQALAWKKNAAMMRGTGAGQPLGWLNASNNALITIAKESGQSADTINEQNVLNMMTRLMVVPGDQPRWIANRNIIPQLSTMTIGDQPVWLPPNGLAGAPGGFLLGYPVMFSEHASTLGDLGDLQLISPRGYYSVVRDAGPQLASSIHLYFDYNIEAFRWMTRFGGQPHLSKAVDAPTAGGGAANSKSHFVVLEERA